MGEIEEWVGEAPDVWRGGGTLKSIYDLVLYFTFRTVHVEGERAREPLSAA